MPITNQVVTEMSIEQLKEKQLQLTERLMQHYKRVCYEVGDQPCSTLHVSFQYGWLEHYKKYMHDDETDALLAEVKSEIRRRAILMG